MERARDHRGDDHGSHVAARMAFHPQQLVEPDRVFVRRAARIGGDPPALHDRAAGIDQREFDIGIAVIDREQHRAALSIRPARRTSPAWMARDRAVRQAQLQGPIAGQARESARERDLARLTDMQRRAERMAGASQRAISGARLKIRQRSSSMSKLRASVAAKHRDRAPVRRRRARSSPGPADRARRPG